MVDWEAGTAEIRLGHQGIDVTAIASGLRTLDVSRKQPWGPSIWVNKTIGPTRTDDGLVKLVIEMQSGDAIVLVAERIELKGDG